MDHGAWEGYDPISGSMAHEAKESVRKLREDLVAQGSLERGQALSELLEQKVEPLRREIRVLHQTVDKFRDRCDEQLKLIEEQRELLGKLAAFCRSLPDFTEMLQAQRDVEYAKSRAEVP